MNALERLAQEMLFLPLDFVERGARSKAMFHAVDDGLLELDVREARQVCQADDEIETASPTSSARRKGQIRQDPRALSRGIYPLSFGRHLERIGDHSTNLAEAWIFQGEADVVRHWRRSQGRRTRRRASE